MASPPFVMRSPLALDDDAATAADVRADARLDGAEAVMTIAGQGEGVVAGVGLPVLDRCARGRQTSRAARLFGGRRHARVGQSGSVLATNSIAATQYLPVLEQFVGDLARRVRKALSLPVAVIQRLPDSALARFEKFHTSAG